MQENEVEVLIERLVAAEGPDRELSHDIGRVMHAEGWHAADCIADFTASYDAAMTLCEPDWWVRMSAPLSPAAYGYSRESERRPQAGMECGQYPYSSGARAATIPLAICAMALRARSSIRAATLSKEGE